VPSVRSTTEPVMRHYNVLEAGLQSHAALRTCMEEREFHIEIAKEKKTVGVITRSMCNMTIYLLVFNNNNNNNNNSRLL